MGKQMKRNPVARATLLRKGGVHEKCRTAKRQQQKRELDDLVSEYCMSRSESESDFQSEDKTATSSGRFLWCRSQIRVSPVSVDHLFYRLGASFVILTA